MGSAFNSGVLSGREAEAILNPLHHHIKLCMTALKDSHDGRLRKADDEQAAFEREGYEEAKKSAADWEAEQRMRLHQAEEPEEPVSPKDGGQFTSTDSDDDSIVVVQNGDASPATDQDDNAAGDNSIVFIADSVAEPECAIVAKEQPEEQDQCHADTRASLASQSMSAASTSTPPSYPSQDQQEQQMLSVMPGMANR